MSGTAPVTDEGHVHSPGQAYDQAKFCFELLAQTLAKFNAILSDVVRTRLFVTDIRLWEEFGRAHIEYFGENPPVTTMVEVSRLIDPEMLIEIEAEAILGN